MELRELERHITTLVELAETDAPCLSCYLDLEGGGYRLALNQRLAVLRKTFPTAEQREDFEAAVAMIEDYLAQAIERETRGVALFARAGSEPFFLPLQFQVPVPDWVVAGALPNIYHLVELKDTYHRFVVMLAGEDSIRVLGVNLGAVTQAIWERRPETRRRVGRGWTKEHYQSHVRERTNQFLLEGVQVLERLMLHGGYRHLILAGNPRATSRIQQALPRQLAAMLIDVVHASANDDVSDVVRAPLLSFTEEEERESLELVERLERAIYTDGLAAAGTPAVWAALRARRADVLIVAKAYAPEESWSCPDCGAVGLEAPRPDHCSGCGGPNLGAMDVKEEMVRLAEQAGCYVEVVNHSETLLRLGGVGCLLRYLAPEQYQRRAA